MNTNEVAVVVGAGPGLGNALSRGSPKRACDVAAVSRRGGEGEPTQRSDLRCYRCDATVRRTGKRPFDHVTAELGPPSLVVFNVGIWDRRHPRYFRRAVRAGLADGLLCRLSGRPGCGSVHAGPCRRNHHLLRRDRVESAAAPASPPLLHRNLRCALWRSRWPANWARRTFMSRMSSLMA